MNTFTLPPAPVSYRLAAFANATPPRPLAHWAECRADEAAQVNFKCDDARLVALADAAAPLPSLALDEACVCRFCCREYSPEDEDIKPGGACPSDDCPSNEKAPDFDPEAYAKEIRAMSDEDLIAAFMAADEPEADSRELSPQLVALCDEINRRAEEFSRTNSGKA